MVYTLHSVSTKTALCPHRSPREPESASDTAIITVQDSNCKSSNRPPLRYNYNYICCVTSYDWRALRTKRHRSHALRQCTRVALDQPMVSLARMQPSPPAQPSRAPAVVVVEGGRRGACGRWGRGRGRKIGHRQETGRGGEEGGRTEEGGKARGEGGGR